jgi:hypothetical protein
LFLLTLVVVTAFGWLAIPAAAQQVTPPPAPPPVRPSTSVPTLLILDSSGSMRADDGSGRPKIEAAKEALLRLVDELPDGAQVGLRAYGHRYDNSDRARGCTDTELLQPVGPIDRPALRQAINGLQPSGYTPIGASLEAALTDIPGQGVRTVVLVSDGIDTCSPPEPCEIAQQMAAANVDLRVETVGFQVDPAAEAQLSCIADVTGGRFRSVDDSAGLLRALREYQVAGSPISGGASAAEAPVLESGQYRDTIQVGQQRWYAVELDEGEVLRATATVVGERGGPVVPDASVSAELFTDDVLGVLSCGREEQFRLGQEARQVGFDGLDTADTGICREPGRFALRLELVDPAGPSSALSGKPFDVELIISIVRNSDQPPPAEPIADIPRADDGLPAAPSSPTSSQYLLSGFLAMLLGGLLGAVFAVRTGP